MGTPQLCWVSSQIHIQNSPPNMVIPRCCVGSLLEEAQNQDKWEPHPGIRLDPLHPGLPSPPPRLQWPQRSPHLEDAPPSTHPIPGVRHLLLHLLQRRGTFPVRLQSGVSEPVSPQLMGRGTDRLSTGPGWDPRGPLPPTDHQRPALAERRSWHTGAGGALTKVTGSAGQRGRARSQPSEMLVSLWNLES